MDFLKVINIGKVKCGMRNYQMFCEIRFNDGRLSICGVEGPTASGGCHGGCGQIQDYVISKYSKEWNEEMSEKFREIWKEWHLNDLTAGSPRQREYLKKYQKEHNIESLDYHDACTVLSEVNLFEDKEYLFNGEPYKYGYGWLFREIPSDVIDFLYNLPTTKIHPAWI